MNRWLKVLLSVGMAGLVAACGGGDDDDDDRPDANIVEVAQGQGFTSLVAAVEKAGLTATLSASGDNVTVFAPTNDAFDELAGQLGFADGPAMVEALSAEALQSILAYHVLPTEESAAELLTDRGQPTLYEYDGAPVELALDFEGDDIVIVDEADTESSVIDSDILASNGTIHSVDKVLVPPGVLTLVQMAQVNPELKELVDALVAADLATPLSGTGPFTVFAPRDDAFEAAAGIVSGLTAEQLRTVLTYHVVDGAVLAADIPFGDPIDTLAGQTITINEGDQDDDTPTITDTTDQHAEIEVTDIRASNGVMHLIDKVLIPTL